MALTTTTLSAAVGANDTRIKLTSTTGFSKGNYIRVDDEIMLQSGDVSGSFAPVVRGVNGTVASAHVSSANAVTGAGSDFANPAAAQTPAYPLGGRRRSVSSYSAAGAISLPTPGSDAVAVINGSGALAMTLASPTKDMDGDLLMIVANGEAAHTVTYTGGFGGGGTGYDVLTFASGAQNSAMCVACNGIWVLLPSLIGGVATAVTVTIA